MTGCSFVASGICLRRFLLLSCGLCAPAPACPAPPSSGPAHAEFSYGAPAAKHYLTRLEAWGYTLSDVERIITDHGQETEETAPGHSLAEIQAEEEEMIAEEASTE